LLQTAVRHTYLRSSVGLLRAVPVERMNALFAELEAQAFADLETEGFPRDAATIRRRLDLRYLHQGYQLTVDAPDEELREEHKRPLKSAFDDLHRRLYGQAGDDEDAEIVTFRVELEVEIERFAQRELARGTGDPSGARTGSRKLFDVARGGFVEAGVYDRRRLAAGDRIEGPAVVTQFDATTVVGAGQRINVDAYGNLIVESGAA
jgi:N-methylhydantoinase A/oxoprolinase/acetone carboxylase beta subunit